MSADRIGLPTFSSKPWSVRMDDPANTTPNPGGAAGRPAENPRATSAQGAGKPYRAPAGGGITPANPTGKSDRRALPDNEVTREIFESAEQQRKAVEEESVEKGNKGITDGRE
jgi:hypothetical protein